MILPITPVTWREQLETEEVSSGKDPLPKGTKRASMMPFDTRPYLVRGSCF